jgi:hypothetical protein
MLDLALVNDVIKLDQPRVHSQACCISAGPSKGTLGILQSSRTSVLIAFAR